LFLFTVRYAFSEPYGTEYNPLVSQKPQ
jgi:hypothetical protein